MEPRSSAQDVHRCDLCENAIVHSYCDFCHVNLCKPCIGEHITDGYDRHKIVPFQQRKSTLIYPKCKTHLHKNCEFICKSCENSLVCSSCMASEQHGGHWFVELSEIYKTMKETIENDAKELVNCISPSYEEIAIDLENQLANLDRGYVKIASEISKQGEEWHRQIDIVVNKMKTEINGIKVKHKDVLQKHLDKIRLVQSLIKQTSHALRDIQESNEVSPIIEYKSKIREFSQLPPNVNISFPMFIPQLIDREKLSSIFGNITLLSTTTEKKVVSLNQANTSTIRILLKEPVLDATIMIEQEELRSLTCLNENMIWTSGMSSDIKCFNAKGSLLHIIKTKSGKYPCGIAVKSDGDLLYSDWSARTVNKVKYEFEQTDKLISLHGWVPCTLCVTSFGDILVTMFSDDATQSKVVRYSGAKEKQTIQFDNEGKPLYSENAKVRYITENRNHDICVTDEGAIVVVNQDGKFRWRYTGHTPTTNKKELFHPFGITTDSQCHVLTSDYSNHDIHILDQNGQFLCYIDNCDLKYPYSVCVDNDDNLYVCERNKGNIKKIRYLK